MPTLFQNIRSRFTKSVREGVTANTADIAATSWTVDMMTGLSNDYMTKCL